jgi:hypothetical protein
MAAAITTTATTLEGQAFEIVQALQILELAIPEADRPNQVTIDTDYEALTAALAVTIPISFVTIAAGKMEISANTYL